MRVLLVEDRDSDALIVQEELAEASEGRVHIDRVADLASALDLLDERPFDVVLLDLSLPDSDGLATLDSVLVTAPLVPVVVITGLDNSDRAEEAVRRGAQDYVVKGQLPGDVLLRLLRYAIERERLLHERDQRVKELSCLYEVTAALRRANTIDEACDAVRTRLPVGVQGARQVRCVIELEGEDQRDRPEGDGWIVVHLDGLGIEGGFVGVEVEGSGRTTEVEVPSLVNQVAATLTENVERIRRDAEERRLAAALRQVGESIIITDTNGTIEYVNPKVEEVTQYSRAELLGKNPRVFKSGEQDDAFYEDFWNTLLSGQEWSGRLVNKRKDGSRFVEEATVSPLLDDEGNLTSFVAVKRDITNEMAVERRRHRAQKLEAVGRLAGGVAHDFNNMLSAIIGYADLIQLELDPDDPLWSDTEEILQAAYRSRDLTIRLLAFSREQTLHPRPVDLAEEVESAVPMLRRLIGERVELRVEADADLECVLMDPTQLHQVVLNLVVNARDAMPEGGPIVLQVAGEERTEPQPSEMGKEIPPGRYIRLSVIDRGTGIEEAVRDQIFEPFFSTKPADMGTGLGLATVLGIVQQSGGYILYDTAVGEGTAFHVLQPVTDERAWKEPDGQALELDRFGGKAATILVVEDESTVRRLVCRILQMNGFHVLEAANGREGLRAAEAAAGEIDLVITDVVMPEMSGPELGRELAARWPDLPVLYMSGYARDEAIDLNGRRLEPTLPKPFTVVDLTRSVEKLLSP